MLVESCVRLEEVAEVVRQTRQSSTSRIARLPFCCAMLIRTGGAMIGGVPA